MLGIPIVLTNKVVPTVCMLRIHMQLHVNLQTRTLVSTERCDNALLPPDQSPLASVCTHVTAHDIQ